MAIYLVLCDLFEEAEINASVCYVSYETQVLREVIVLAMFKDEETVLAQHLSFENHVGDFSQLLQCIWRVSKDDVVFCTASAYEAENIVSYNSPTLVVE